MRAAPLLDRVVLRNITKSFGAFCANDGVNLTIREGSIHAILGENGAGKSTLMNIIYGLYKPDAGEILLRGERVEIDNPRQALKFGIGMVHQHFKLVDDMTVTENIILGLSLTGRLHLKSHSAAIHKLARGLGFEIETGKKIWELPVGMQQRVEILKLLYRNADLLILDEPTSILAPTEVEPFFDLLRSLKEKGQTIIIITHKLAEVMAIADRVTVLWKGRVSSELEIADATPGRLAKLMVTEHVDMSATYGQTQPGDVWLEVEKLVICNEHGVNAVDGLDLQVRSGEILGIAGVDGNGQQELAEGIAGLRKVDAGEVRIKGRNVRGHDVGRRKHDFKLGFVPEDRQKTALDLDNSIAFNLVLRNYGRKPYSKCGWIDFNTIDRHALHLSKKYDIRMRGIDQRARDLSGGNQQKIILAREIEDEPDVLVVSQPTKGLDIGAAAFVHRTIAEQRARGKAILYISTEFEELFKIADRIAVISKGRIVGTVNPQEANLEQIGLLLAGVPQ